MSNIQEQAERLRQIGNSLPTYYAQEIRDKMSPFIDEILMIVGDNQDFMELAQLFQMADEVQAGYIEMLGVIENKIEETADRHMQGG